MKLKVEGGSDVMAEVRRPSDDWCLCVKWGAAVADMMGGASYLVLGAAAEPWPGSCPLSSQPHTDRIPHPTWPNPKSGGYFRPVQPATHMEKASQYTASLTSTQWNWATTGLSIIWEKLRIRWGIMNHFQINRLEWIQQSQYWVDCAVLTGILIPLQFCLLFLELSRRLKIKLTNKLNTQ